MGEFTEHIEGPEQFPSREEIESVFNVVLKGKTYKESGFKSDEMGVSLYEIEIALENGEKIELNYQRANYDYRSKSFHPNLQFSGSIHIITYDATGRPYGGTCVASYLDGKWVYPK